MVLVGEEMMKTSWTELDVVDGKINSVHEVFVGKFENGEKTIYHPEKRKYQNCKKHWKNVRMMIIGPKKNWSKSQNN